MGILMLPNGEYIYEGLGSEFVELDKLVGELIQEEVTGYISFEDEDIEGFGLIERGEIKKIKVIENGDSYIKEGRTGLAEIFQEGEYMIDVVKCNEAARQIVEIKINNEEVRSDVSSGGVDLPKFLATNITDQANDCHLIVVSEDETGVITMLDGLPTEAKFNSQEEILVGNQALDKIIEYIEQEDDAHIDIYKIPEEEKEEVSYQEQMHDQIEGELQDISDSFEEKADNIVDEMGLGMMSGDGDEDGDELDLESDFEEEADDLLEDMGIETEEN
ncbi:MAG: hypothetical protein SXQ77_03200 [Halobacteria archaeon]|nr:hypothetical protein [Halobacteria archaeon]